MSHDKNFDDGISSTVGKYDSCPMEGGDNNDEYNTKEIKAVLKKNYFN